MNKQRSQMVENLLKDAIEALDEHLSNRGCNDLVLPNDPEIHQLWAEFNEWNSGAKDSNHKEWIRLSIHGDQQQTIGNDAFYIFLLKKYLNLIPQRPKTDSVNHEP